MGYDLDKDEFSDIADAFNIAIKDAGDPDTGNATVVADLNTVWRYVEDYCPASWYTARDHEFKRLCSRVEAASVERREELVRDWFDHFITLVYNELELEP